MLGKKLVTLGAASLVFGLAAQSQSIELVTNGDFEILGADNTQSPGWTLGGVALVDDWSFFFPMPTVSAWMGGLDDTVDSVSQDINMAGTVGTVTLRFDLGIDPFDGVNFDFLTIKFGGDVLDVIDLGNDTSSEFIGPNPMTYDLSAYAGSGTKKLEFITTTDESAACSALIDNVSITANVVPEPATLAVLGLGMLGLRRRRKA